MLGQSFGDCDVAVKVPVKVPGTFTQGLSPRDFHSHWDFDLVKFYQVRTSYLYILVCTEDMPLYTCIYQYIPVYTVLIPIYSSLYTVYTGIYQVSAEFSGYVVLYFLTIFILS